MQPDNKANMNASIQFSSLSISTTLLQGKGAYTGAEKQVLLVAFRQREIVPIKRMLQEIDPKAFFIVCDAHEILGEGFGDYQKEEI